MADASEDILSDAAAQVTRAEPSESDSGDEDRPSDFRFLSVHGISSSLPKRGVKDFEPHALRSQQSALVASRDAMRAALSFTRTHLPKSHVVGVYDLDTGLTHVKRAKGALFEGIGRGLKDGAIQLLPEEALWALERGSLDVRWPQSMGNGGAVDAPQTSPIDELDNVVGEEDSLGLPMSLQGAYAAFIGAEPRRGGSLTLEKYQVFAALKRAGFIVLRAEGFDGTSIKKTPEDVESDPLKSLARATSSPKTLLNWLHDLVLGSRVSEDPSRLRFGPLVQPGLYRSYSDVFSKLRIIPAHDSVLAMTAERIASSLAVDQDRHCTVSPVKIRTSGTEASPSPYTTTFNLYRTNAGYRKSNPGKPLFRICVIAAADTAVPTVAEAASLMAEQEWSPHTSLGGPKRAIPSKSIVGPARGQKSPHTPRQPTQSGPRTAPVDAHATAQQRQPQQATIGPTYARLKHGTRNVILAVVDSGIVNYLRLAEAPFAAELVSDVVVAGAGRKKGGGAGRGRGGSRGGRGRGRGRG